MRKGTKLDYQLELVEVELRTLAYLHCGVMASYMKIQENTDSRCTQSAGQIELLSHKPNVCFFLSSNFFH